MGAVVIDLADAVAAALNGATLSQEFAAERLFVPVYAVQSEEGPDDLATLRVVVVAMSLTMAELSRRDDEFDYVIDIGILKRIGTGAMSKDEIRAATDPLMQLAEEVLDLFRGKPLAVGDATLTCVAGANSPIYHAPHLDDQRVFTSILSLTFRHFRAR